MVECNTARAWTISATGASLACHKPEAAALVIRLDDAIKRWTIRYDFRLMFRARQHKHSEAGQGHGG
eukprot:1924023-Lingulodinium_polyedra.AAC.1